jgi:type III restriction enzyme
VKIELMDFQEDAVQVLLRHVRNARKEARDGDAQAIVLSSPTGSGKTATVTALLERLWQGDQTTHEPDPEAVFLWLSDSPELNAQSRDKILAQSSAFREDDLIILEPSFRGEQFDPGRVHFLNTQKLTKDSLLTRKGERRDYTIWETIENTAQAKPDHFYLVIDEAHRGMNLSARELKQAQTIVQKFIFGDPEVGLSPVKLILGISATPERFAKVLEKSTRTRREHNVDQAAVRASGLLKERIVLYCPEEEQPADWTLLSEATKRWKRFRANWRRYSKEQGAEPVEPVLVIQVEDGAEGNLTRTDLARAVGVLEREAGQFGAGALAHCFEVEGAVAAGGYSIRKIEPSKIEQDTVARVVFFKMALSTGWDCPRAEVMMSFRKARDHTLIAQLVGRMVRTPLARRIEGSELLNTVSLYLPHYDRAGLGAIVEKLNDPENAPPTEVVVASNLVTLKRDPAHEDLFAALARLPSYSVERVPKTSNVRRFVKLARRLTCDEVDAEAWGGAKALVVRTLSEELDRLREDPRFARLCKANQVIEIREVQIEAGEWRQVDEGKVIRVETTPENIDDLFDLCRRMLGEGLHGEFWREKSDRQDPQQAKLELFGVLHDEAAWRRLEKLAGEQIDRLLDQHDDAIAALPTSKQEEYNHVRRRAKDPQPIRLLFPHEVDVNREEPLWEQHLYVDDAGKFGWDANTWESAVLKDELGSEGFAAWLRNFARKPWSLCIPYRHKGEDRPLYPDLIVFRRAKGKLRVDLLDPHNPKLSDAVDKAVGLARYAGKHGSCFGRIELISVGEGGRIRRLDVNRAAIREKAKAVGSRAHLEALFEGQV